MTDYTKLEQIVESNSDVILDMAAKVWDWAELGFKEQKSSAYEAAVLEKNGFKMSDRGIGGLDTSWIATWGTGSPVVGIMVEFDALPDLGNDIVATKTPRKDGVTNGHGCGHNLIGSGAVGAAISLKAHMEKERIAGTIKVFGCPAEELLTGKNYMAKAGAFDGLDAVFHHHPGPRNLAFNFSMQASMDLTIEWQGKSAHAAVAPWDGRSALHASEVFTTAANCMREQVLPTCRLHYFMTKGPKAVNTIPDRVQMVVRFRGKNAEIVQQGTDWLKDIAKAAALATQTTVKKVEVITGLYDLLPNNVIADRVTDHLNRYFPVEWSEEEQAFARSIQKEMGKPEDGMTIEVEPNPNGALMGGSTEVGDVSWCVPTGGAIFAAWPHGVPPHTWGCTACNGMSIGHKAVIQATHVLAATALDFMTDAELLKSARAEFDERTAGKPYKSLNVLDAPPGGMMDDEARHDYECCIHGAMAHFGIKEPGV
jgi:aminobenzoyl-glutamate utilization protein B